MEKSELEKFAQQLAAWTELIIENGRTPFRRVDLYPTIHTAAGKRQPPLVFWINRQSMMAGGILLLPGQDLDAELSNGRYYCEALGLKHFVTWESDRVRIWQVDADKVRQHQQFELQNPEHPDSFRLLLGDILEALKLLAVIGLVPNHELSEHYLHNLFQATLDHALPALINCYRSQRAEDSDVELADADQLAGEANRLLLLQLVSLTWHQKLPTTILPEKLQRAVEISLPELPAELQQTLSLAVTGAAPELPHDAAVCFHHLLLRLRQLAWQQDKARALGSIQQLISGWFDEHSQPPQAEVLLYPQSIVLSGQVRVVISDSPSLLAALRVLEDLQQQPAKQLQYGNLFELDLDSRQPLSMAGNLLNTRLLSREERQHYQTLLRKSWPNRRFRISGNKPLWYWELIHLFGLGKTQKTLSLTVPREVLLLPAEDLFWELLVENYTLTAASKEEGELVGLDFSPEPAENAVVDVIFDKQLRRVLAAEQLALFRNQLLLALQLAEPLYQVLTEKLIWPEDDEITDNARAGLDIYLNSHLWNYLSSCLKIELSDHEELFHQQLKTLPRPDSLHLDELAHTALAATLKEPRAADQLLAEVLQAPEILTISSPADKLPKRSSPANQTDKDLKSELIKQLESTGIPNFPEQYLYFLDAPETTTFQLTPPLSIKSELLGEFELVDANNKLFRVYGEELCTALLLCSTLDKTEVELPTDLNQLALLQQQYWNDMRQLYKQLSSLCHSRLKSSKAADKLTKKIWKTLSLPKLP